MERICIIIDLEIRGTGVFFQVPHSSEHYAPFTRLYTRRANVFGAKKEMQVCLVQFFLTNLYGTNQR